MRSRMYRTAARADGTNAVDFRSEVAFYRDSSRGPQRFEIDDVKLLAEALMLFEAALRADGRADFQTG